MAFNIKKIKHHLRKEKYIKQAKKYAKEQNDLAQQGQLKDIKDLVINLADENLISDDNYMNTHRRTNIKYLFKSKPGRRTSRLALSEYEHQVMEIMGIVADINTETKHPRILIENAVLMKDGQRIQYVDEHLWCFLKDIVGRGSDVVGNQEIAVGDYIIITTKIKPYLGKSLNIKHYGYRWGIGKAILREVGQPIRVGSGVHQDFMLINSYDRQGDWIVKFHKLPLMADTELEHYDNKTKNNNITFEIRNSRYASYYERTHENKTQK